ncbi:MAG: HAD family hydrolase [Candidatus Wallbacteria bacterium]|nr:HAD family hydrolase [Candidatus Wallbacteria bacterium]
MKKAFFFDRDGTLIVERNYLHDPAAVALLPGVPEVLKKLKEMGFLLLVVTNQAGIAKGMYNLAAAQAVNEELNRKSGGLIDDFLICPHHPDYSGPCSCRKPEPGMIFEARDRYVLDLESSFLVGDKHSDVLCGLNAGLKKSFLVLTGYGESEQGKVAGLDCCVVESLENLLDWI